MDEKVLSKLDELKKLMVEQTLLKKEVLSAKEAAVYLGLSLGYLYELTSKNKFPAYKPNGGKLYFNRKELDNWMLSKPKRSKSDWKEPAGEIDLQPGIESDCKSLVPECAGSQLTTKTGRN